MARANAVRRRAHVGLLCATALSVANAQSTTYYFSGAVQVSGVSSESTAVQAQCPSDHPVSCTNLSEPDYCCPSNNVCAWSNSQVACCPSGQTCADSGYQSTTYYQPTTTYYTPTTTYYTNEATTVGGGGVVVPAGYTEGQTTTAYQATTTAAADYGNGAYCSTLVEVGPNLPTTAAGNCGTILIVEPSEAARIALAWLKLGAMIVGLQALGGLVLARR